MTRFDAASPEARRELVVAAIEAHRERESLFCTLEADAPPGDDAATATGEADASDVSDAGDEADGDGGDSPDEDGGGDEPAWIQYSERETQLNLDCTDAEYDLIVGVLDDFPAFSVEEQSAPEDADGRNLRISAYGDDERIAQLVDRLFVEGFDYDEAYRLWATEV